MDFKFNWKSFVSLELLLTFGLPFMVAGVAKQATVHQAWMIGAIMACVVQIGELFLLRFVSSMISQAPSSMRDMFKIKFDTVPQQNAKLLIRMVLALLLAYTGVRSFAFVGAFVAVTCVIRSMINPLIEKMILGEVVSPKPKPKDTTSKED